MKYLCIREYKTRHGYVIIHHGQISDVEKIDHFYFIDKCLSLAGYYFSEFEISHHFLKLDIVIDYRINDLLELC